jgi:hypothetical protein
LRRARAKMARSRPERADQGVWRTIWKPSPGPGGTK